MGSWTSSMRLDAESGDPKHSRAGVVKSSPYFSLNGYTTTLAPFCIDWRA
ncbi:hypothetical protein [Thermogymnomonas acidicola]|nr:hypothetical protein [Thermogymnomonas acidicola]